MRAACAEIVFEYYTVKRANAAIPDVSKKYVHVVECKDAVMRAERALQECMSSDSDLEAYSTRKQTLNSALADFYLAVRDLEKTGAVIKGIDDGLVDFPSRRFDDDVWLCWKYGEPEVKFWHEKDSGFRNRKPLAVSDESLT